MNTSFKLSIVTPCREEGIEALLTTIDSLRQVQASEVEHIIVFLGEEDRLRERISSAGLDLGNALLRFSPASGAGQAIFQALYSAQGKWAGILYPGSQIYPQTGPAIQRAAGGQQTPAILLGRVAFLSDHGQETGAVYPPTPPGRRDEVLSVWQSAWLMLPAMFWPAPMIASANYSLVPADDAWLDFFLFCEFTQDGRFITDPDARVSCPYTPGSNFIRKQNSLEVGLAISRAHWPGPSTLAYYRLAAGYWRHAFHRTDRAKKLIHKTREDWQAGRDIVSFAQWFLAAFLAPDVLFYTLIFPALRGWLIRRISARGS